MASKETLKNILASKLQQAKDNGYKLCERDEKFLEVAKGEK